MCSHTAAVYKDLVYFSVRERDSGKRLHSPNSLGPGVVPLSKHASWLSVEPTQRAQGGRRGSGIS